jgi:hypothetical protein
MKVKSEGAVIEIDQMMQTFGNKAVPKVYKAHNTSNGRSSS